MCFRGLMGRTNLSRFGHGKTALQGVVARRLSHDCGACGKIHFSLSANKVRLEFGKLAYRMIAFISPRQPTINIERTPSLTSEAMEERSRPIHAWARQIHKVVCLLF
jgi:hypothetical protein